MNKIEALQKTIYNLENNVYRYQWDSCNDCNCGILSRTIMGGKSPYEGGFLDAPFIKRIEWPFSENAYCMTTNLPLQEVFQSFKDSGFSFEDILNLESLGDDKIITRLRWDKKHSKYTTKKYVILYLKEWVKMLQEREPKIKFVTYSKIIQNIPVNAN